MKKILSMAALAIMGCCMFTACDDDHDENPVLQSPEKFVLNTPALANATIDLANSSKLVLTCSQPDYGFTALTSYTPQVSLSQDMSNFVELESSTSAKVEIDAPILASTLTTMQLEAGKTEADFPMNIPVYIRLKACVTDKGGVPFEGTEILSNVITLSDVRLLYSLPPVKMPEKIYLIGNFCNWNWDSCLEMVPVHGTDNIFWHMVYIDGGGVKINTNKAWDGGDIGFGGITVSGDLKDDIIDAGGNIASANPGWYLMVVTTSVSGRDIVYDIQFNKPEVYAMGPVIGGWDELSPAGLFSVPSTADGEFVSPAFIDGVPGGDGDGVRAYVKVPGYDWWKAEFMVFDKKIVYRGKGDDQARVAGAAGQKLYLNFGKETGEIK